MAALLLARGARADAPPRLIEAPEVQAPSDGSLAPDASASLEITVDPTGAVTDVAIVRGTGRDDVDAQIREATLRMRFAPAERDGQPVAARLRFRFRLRASPPGAGSDTGVATPPASDAGTPGDAGAVPADGTDRGAQDAAAPAPVPDNPYGAGAPPPPTVRAVQLERGVLVRGRHEAGAATRESFRAEELTTVPGTFGEPTRIVATLPGVARTPFGLGFFVVRGASFENTGFFVDGYPVLILYHLAAGPAVISSRLVGQLDFYPGGYPVEYGRFSAGVISLTTRPPPTDRPRAEIEVDFLRASLLGVQPFASGRGSVAIALRRSYYDFLLPLLAPGVLLNYTDGQLRADYRFSDRVSGSLFLFGSGDFFDRTEAVGQGATAATARDALRYNFGRAIAKLEYRGPGGLVGQWSAMLGYDDTGIVQADPGRADRGVNAGGATFGQRLSLRFPTGRALTTTIGLDTLGYAYDVRLAFASPSGFGNVPPPLANPRVANIASDVTQFGIAAYIEEVLRTGRLEFTAGMRLEYVRYSTNSHILPDPRAVVRYRFLENATAVAATGYFHQAPPVFALIPQAGNPDLLPQRSWQSSAGVELTLPLQLESRVTGFFNRMWQLPRATYETIMTPEGPRRALALSDGEGRSFGVEFLLRRKLSRGIYGWLSYTLSRSERFIGDGRVVPFTFDQTHVLNLAASWDIDRRFRVGARFQLATGSPTSAISGAIFDADADGYRPQYVSEADRLPLYHQLDLRVDYLFRLGPYRMSAYLDVLNTYYARNAEGWVYQYNYEGRVPRPGLPILPTLGIRGEL